MAKKEQKKVVLNFDDSDPRSVAGYRAAMRGEDTTPVVIREVPNDKNPEQQSTR
ncbi:hypothetical protein LRY65_00310 [Candidatus Woesebacteria bacterium]|nr:hypothetical protein [Candidatus Woesebacteria bacterium]MCD8507758.1 hypothetical protein [Candidatus Woesebacteria bacterium]MCD8526648.1 hypothetical protein [Candidatus Woesebacteria bacterium]MCD8545884.1 hypothetical protein [Candidatus Woesebacteria bacterium]